MLNNTDYKEDVDKARASLQQAESALSALMFDQEIPTKDTEIDAAYESTIHAERHLADLSRQIQQRIKEETNASK